jgi:hypothetical protein
VSLLPAINDKIVATGAKARPKNSIIVWRPWLAWPCVLMVLLLLASSLWIMANLNHNMMPMDQIMQMQT